MLGGIKPSPERHALIVTPTVVETFTLNSNPDIHCRVVDRHEIQLLALTSY